MPTLTVRYGDEFIEVDAYYSNFHWYHTVTQELIKPELIYNVKDQIMAKQLPPEIENILNEAARRYSESEATTNLGRVGRFFARFIKPSTIIKIFAHKLG